MPNRSLHWLPLLALGLFQAALSLGATPPNVLFIIADDASQKLGKTYGCDWIQTPHIDRLAREGLAFDNVYVPTSKCAPCRAAILTGRNPWQNAEAGNHQAFFPSQLKTFSEALAEAGVKTGKKGKVWGPGIALTGSGENRTFALPNAEFARFLKERPKDQPFFYWFGSANPHRPYKLDDGKAQGKKTTDIDRVPGYLPDTELVRSDLLDYATEVEAFDREVGELVAALEASGEAANTLIIVTSDHGMPFPRVKGHTYDDAHRVPFVVRWPAGIARPGTRVPELVSLIDLAPTFLQLHGITGLAQVTGKSLTDLFAGTPKEDRSFVLIGRERNDVRARPGTPHGLGYPARGIRMGNLLYVRNFEPDRWPCGNPELGITDTEDSLWKRFERAAQEGNPERGFIDTDSSPAKTFMESLGTGNPFWEHSFGKRPSQQLFDLEKDPDCVHNLATTEGEALARLSSRLETELKRQEDPRILGKGDIFDNYPSTAGAPRVGR